MTGFLSKWFGGKKKDLDAKSAEVVQIVDEIFGGMLKRTALELDYDIDSSSLEDGELQIEISGPDSEFLTERDGSLLESFQLFLKRAIQHRLPEDRTTLLLDCQGFREENSQALLEMAEKLKNVVLQKNRSVYCRALPPKDRKVIHQYLAEDERVRSKSVGDGLYKKIKIFPARAEKKQQQDQAISP